MICILDKFKPNLEAFMKSPNLKSSDNISFYFPDLRTEKENLQQRCDNERVCMLP